MNERIRELAEQAFTAVGTTHDSITHQDQSVLDKNNSITSYTFTQNTMEKFAELLIRECIDRVRTQYIPVRDQLDRTEREQGIVECGVNSVIALEELVQESTEQWYKENMLDDE